ncbi:MAG: DMT family transporter [Qingshengfaniella sp.]
MSGEIGYQRAAPNNMLGIALMMLTTVMFSVQDGLSRYLSAEYNVLMIVMIRYWFFAVFVTAIAARSADGLRATIATRQPILQIVRGLLLALEICVIVLGFLTLGLVGTHAVFICNPLIIAALSGPVLGEKVGLWRWLAIAVGFVGVLIALNPGAGVIGMTSLIPLAAAFLFALYGLLTRLASEKDSTETSFFWTGVTGAVAMSVIGAWFWEPVAVKDWGWLALLCLSGSLGHFVLIKCYEVAEVSAVQPFAYLHLVFVCIIGVFVFGETLYWNIVVGGAVVLAAGLFTLWRDQIRRGR